MTDKLAPIYSSVEDVPELRERINEFVIGLAERVDHLQDAEGSGDLETLGELATRLMRDAEEAGYAPLVEIASHVRSASRDDKPEIAQKALVLLTEMAQRVRLGHRGAA